MATWYLEKAKQLMNFETFQKYLLQIHEGHEMQMTANKIIGEYLWWALFAYSKGRRVYHRLRNGFTSTNAINAYHH